MDLWIEVNGKYVTEMSTWSANGYPMPDGSNGQPHVRSLLNHEVQENAEGEIEAWEFTYKNYQCKVFND